MADQTLIQLKEKRDTLKRKINAKTFNCVSTSTISLLISLLPFTGSNNRVINAIFFGLIPFGASAISAAGISKVPGWKEEFDRIDDLAAGLQMKRDRMIFDNAYEPEEEIPQGAMPREKTEDEMFSERFFKLIDTQNGIKVVLGQKELFDLDNSGEATHIRYRLFYKDEFTFDQVVKAIAKSKMDLSSKLGLYNPQVIDTLNGAYLVAENLHYKDFVRPDRFIIRTDGSKWAQSKKVDVLEPEPVENFSDEPISQPEKKTFQNEESEYTPAPKTWHAQPQGMGKKSYLPTEDIAALMVRAATNPQTARSVFIIAPSGTGKTALLQTALQGFFKVTGANNKVFVFAGKQSERYCGIETLEGGYQFDSSIDELIPQSYCYAGDPDNSEYGTTFLKWINKTYTARNHGYPVLVIADENNMIIKACVDFDKVDRSKHKKTLTHHKTASDYSIAVRGRSQQCFMWMSAHSTRKEDTGQSTAIFSNVAAVILGRTLDDGTPSYGSISEALRGQAGNRVIDDTEIRETLLEQFQKYRSRINDGLEDGSKVLCLTSVGGKWRLCLLPYYEKNTANIDLSLVEADDEYAEFDSEFEEKYGTQPETELNEPQKPDTLEQLLAILKDWVSTANPTETELKAKIVALGDERLLQFLDQIKKDIGFNG
jgi:hypothetical protein